MKALWPAFHAGLTHVEDLQCWAEWWILRRRVAAGLNRSHHEEMKPGGAPRRPGRPRPEPHESAEM